MLVLQKVIERYWKIIQKIATYMIKNEYTTDVTWEIVQSHFLWQNANRQEKFE